MTKLLIDDLAFAEGPRWHEDRLWISDMHSQKMLAIDLAGKSETICHVPQDPSGLGWRPDGTLLVVSMRDRRLLAWTGLHRAKSLLSSGSLPSCYVMGMEKPS